MHYLHFLFLFFLFNYCSIAVSMEGERQGKTLYQHFGIEAVQDKPRVTTLIAKHIVGEAGWWYPRTILHHNTLRVIVFNPESDEIATASQDNAAFLWNFEGHKLATFPHERFIESIAFKPDGSMLATASRDKTACLWDRTGKKLATLQHGNRVTAVVFHPKDNKVATGSRDHTAIVWDFQGNKLNVLRHNSWVKDLAFHPEGHMLVTVNGRKKAILWNLLKKTRLKEFGHKGFVESVSFHPKGDMIATGARDGTAKLWDLAQEKVTVIEHSNLLPPRRCRYSGFLRTKTAAVSTVACHPEGNLVATGGGEYMVFFWDLNGKRCITLDHWSSIRSMKSIPPYKRAKTTAITFHPKGSLLATASQDYNTAVIWQQHHPTVEQVLFRLLLKKYFIECIVQGKNPAIHATSERLVPWMAETFKLDQPKLQRVWNSFPLELQSSIIRRLVHRSSQINPLPPSPDSLLWVP